MRDLAKEYLLLRVTPLLDGWKHSLTSGDARASGVTSVLDTTSTRPLVFSYPVTTAITDAEKMLGKPLLKEKQEMTQQVGSWEQTNRVAARFGIVPPALPSLHEARRPKQLAW
uniref:Uncharacterized protein n=1 Tax=Oryza punctata TaxID=4537 RepID=A0A0E0LBU9_ORYPU